MPLFGKAVGRSFASGQTSGRQEDRLQCASTKQRMTRDDALGRDTSHDDALGRDTSHDDALGRDTSHDDALGRDTSHDDALGRDTSHDDALGLIFSCLVQHYVGDGPKPIHDGYI
ncbi:hypothetical protein LSAT2_017933 [Lamellibrachia satsuma]|nr:hypothetical protein LSAT2_017933 [Lamellibrachia satsuma]